MKFDDQMRSGFMELATETTKAIQTSLATNPQFPAATNIAIVIAYSYELLVDHLLVRGVLTIVESEKDNANNAARLGSDSSTDAKSKQHHARANRSDTKRGKARNDR